jgi:hypothetical protein
MIVYEFYLKDAVKAQAFDVLCNSFIALGNCTRKVDAINGSCVYSVSRNPSTHWVQLLVDDNTPEGILAAIEAKINGLCDAPFNRYSDPHDNIAPREKPRATP